MHRIRLVSNAHLRLPFIWGEKETLLATTKIGSLSCHYRVVNTNLYNRSPSFIRDNFEVNDQKWKRELEDLQRLYAIFFPLGPTNHLVVGLNRLQQSDCSSQARANFWFKVVQAISQLFGDRKSQLKNLLEDIVTKPWIFNELSADILVLHQFQECFYSLDVRGYLARYLHQNQDAFFCISRSLPVQLATSDLHGDIASPVGSHPETISKNTQSDGREHRKHAADRRPSIPPNYAVLAQRPALINPLQHAHSLIPLWIGRHFAMGAPRAAA